MKVAEHKDIEDDGQTVLITERIIKIHTTATDKDGNKEIEAGKDVTIIDTVTLEGLEVGTQYKLVGWQMLKEENAELLINGKRVERDYTFTADSETMKVEVTFTQITWFVITEFIIILFGDIPPLSMIEGAFLKYLGIPVALTWFMSQKTFDGKKPYSFLKSQITYALRPKITYAGKAVKLHKQILNETITAVRSVNDVPDKIY